MHSLPIFVRLEGRPVILVGDGDQATAKRQLLVRAGASIVEEGAVAALAIVAIEDDDLARAAAARLKARAILVNVTDRPDLCDFTLPAIVDRDPVLIAIGTGGASAGLAKALRQRLERLLPASLGGLAKALQAARPKMRQRWPDATRRRQAIDLALESGGALDALLPLAENAVDRWIGEGRSETVSGVKTMTLHSDDPDQLTLAQARLLAQADLIVHASGIAVAILARGRADAVRLEADVLPDPLPDGLTVQLVRASG